MGRKLQFLLLIGGCVGLAVLCSRVPDPIGTGDGERAPKRRSLQSTDKADAPQAAKAGGPVETGREGLRTGGDKSTPETEPGTKGSIGVAEADAKVVSADPQEFSAAVVRGDVDAVRKMLGLHKELATSLDGFGGRGAIHLAALHGRDDVLRLLVGAGCQVDAPEKLLGQSPLHLAAAAGRAGTVQTLLVLGAKPNAKDNQGDSPLFDAAAFGHAEAVTVLLKGGANPNQRGSNDSLPLELPAKRGQTSVIQALLAGGADPKQLSGGATPFYWAVAGSHAEAALVLLNATRPNRPFRCPQGTSLVVDTPVAFDDNGGVVDRGAASIRCETAEGLEEGESLSFFASGERRFEYQVLDGAGDLGLSMSWYRNGRVESRIEWRDYDKHGKEQRWHPNGERMSEAVYVEGKLKGADRRWNDAGKPIE